MNKNRGKEFEKQIQDSLDKEGVYTLRLYDPMGGYSNVANPCDFIVYKQPTLLLLECKSCYGASLPRSNITDNQWKSLLDADNLKGILAGYIIWFIDKDFTVFISAINLDAYYRLNPEKKSIPFTDALSIGYEIKGTKRRVLFDYEMKEFLNYVSQSGRDVIRENISNKEQSRKAFYYLNANSR